MFTPLPDNFSYPALEHEIIAFWREHKTFERSTNERKDAPAFSFFEGPPTVNGRPGVHHLFGRTIKDLVCRYKTMKGFFVRRQAGWDTHGLPVEIAVERELGLTQKNQIDSYGVEKFNNACKALVYKNIRDTESGWGKFTERMGYWVNLDDAYITCTNDYIESVWWAVKQYFDKGLIYKGFRIVPQSPTIETPLSSHELSLGYKDVRDPNCYIKLKVTESAHLPQLVEHAAELLVWTTTPWTLISNVALAVGRDIDYVLVRNTRKQKLGNETVSLTDVLVLAEARLSVLEGDTEILSTFKGSDLVGTHYEQIFPYVHLQKEKHPNALTVIFGEFVSTSDGSGIVHIAPAFGADDYEMSKKFNLPFVQPVTPGGRFVDNIGEFSGRTVKTFTYGDGTTEEGVDKDVVIALKKAGKIYRSTNDYLHSYPHCWRTGNPVIYYARDSWFIKSPEVKNSMVELNKTIGWQPPEIGVGRFGNWLEDVKDWSLSRDRYWGTPLPLWIADDGEVLCIGSIEELREGMYDLGGGSHCSVRDIEKYGVEIDLHRPFVDNIHFERNGKVYRRTHEVLDVWFDSGAMPFAQFHYPFENKELFEQQFPADFIAEGIDQTRGWFYTLHNISTTIFGKPAFKNIVVNELVLDKDGQKMSKSKGNTVDPFWAMETFGADAVRWYLMVNNPPWKPTRFNADDIANTVIADFFRSLTNTYAFFSLYANIDGFTGNEEQVPMAERPEIDRWMLSRLQTVLQEYLTEMDAYEITRAFRVVQDFVRDDVSNWYVRRNRRRFWKGAADADKHAAYQTLRTVMITVLEMLAPGAPFLAEFLYRRLRLAHETESIHLRVYAAPNTELRDEALERRMAKAQNLVFLVRSLREKSRIRTRQPLARILVPVLSPADRRDIQAVEAIICEEINVKAIEFVTDDGGVLKKSAKPNFKTLGKRFGKETQHIANAIRAFSPDEIRTLERVGTISIQVNEISAEILLEDVEITSQDIEGWLVATGNGQTVALDTELTPALRNEGLAREFVNRIQSLRKDSGLEVTDRISIMFTSEQAFSEAILAMSTYICQETLAVKVLYNQELTSGQELDIEPDLTGGIVRVAITKI